MPEFAPVINVSSLNGANGIRLDGDAANDYSGRAVGGGGDVDGDGFADVLIGASLSNTGGNNRGLAWVVFGAASLPNGQTLSARVAAGGAYRFQGESAGDGAGFSVSNAGDVNGDGIDDILIDAAFLDGADSVRGAAYIVFGGGANLEALDNADLSNDNQISLSTLSPAQGFRLEGVADGDTTGYSVAGAGDIDGDGLADLLVDAHRADPLGGQDNGATYVVFGADLDDLDDDDIDGADGRISLANVTGGKGILIAGERLNINDHSGYSVSGAGDINGDGFADVIVGAFDADPNSGAGNGNEGAAYLVFGAARADLPIVLDLTNASGLDAVRLEGLATLDRTGFAVSGLGDVNGDGFDDVLIGAPFADVAGVSDAGAAYVVFGRAGWRPTLDLSTLDGTNGFRLDGLRQDDITGRSVSAAGDVNGDGFEDLLIGAPEADERPGFNAGAAYVVFGKALGFAAVIDLGNLDGNNGFRINGASGDALGYSVSAAGDVNGDGFDDLLLGAFEAGGLNFQGASYIIYGHRAQTAVERVGTEFADRINGGIDDDTVTGLSGADLLTGWEGDDLISGGAGGDTLDGGADDDDLRGGSGIDTFLASLGDDTAAGGSNGDNLDFVNVGGGVTASLEDGEALFAGSRLVFTSIERLLGTAAADRFTGDARVNLLNGRNGDDTLDGGDGNDIVMGGRGADQLMGGGGADRFDFNSVVESGTTPGTRDTISGFTVSSDRIDLSTIDAIPGVGNDAFIFKTTGGFNGPGQVRATQSGADTLVEINTGGNGGAEASILLQGVTASTLAAADFVL